MPQFKFVPKYFVFKAGDRLVLPVETDKGTLCVEVFSVSCDKYDNVIIKGKLAKAAPIPGFEHNGQYFFKNENVIVENKYIKKQGIIKAIDYKDRFYVVENDGTLAVSNITEYKLSKI